MTDTDIKNTTTTTLDTEIPTFSVAPQTLDVASPKGETRWRFKDWTTNLAYYKTIPELKAAIDAMVMWTTGKGWTADATTTVTLNRMRGWGNESFQEIMRNHDTITQVNGDSFTEIIRNDTGTLINLKVLDPSRVAIVVGDNGLIKFYEEWDGKDFVRRLNKDKILHSSENRIGSEIHGVSKIDSCKGTIDFRNEMLADLRRIMHRSTIRVMYIDADDTTRLTQIKTEYASAIKNGELMIIPAKKGEAEFEDLTLPPTTAYLEVIRYTESTFYKTIGTPEIILGGIQQTTEASSKVGFLTFEQPYMTRQRLLEDDFWNQVALKFRLERPVSLKDNVQGDEAKNTGQTGFQNNETETGVGRTE